MAELTLKQQIAWDASIRDSAQQPALGGVSNADIDALVAGLHSFADGGKYPIADEAASTIVALRQWRAALEEACIVSWSPIDESDPQGTLNKLIAWEQTIALDPQVSRAAAELRDTYLQRAEAAEQKAGELLLKANYEASRREEAERNAARYLNAIFLMADDGWLMYGEEGMSKVQEQVYAIAQEHPEYKRRAAIDAAMKAKP